MSAKAAAKNNGVAPTAIEQPQTHSLELYGAELELLHSMLSQSQFPTVQLKQIAASLQSKVEQVAQQLQETQ